MTSDTTRDMLTQNPISSSPGGRPEAELPPPSHKHPATWPLSNQLTLSFIVASTPCG